MNAPRRQRRRWTAFVLPLLLAIAVAGWVGRGLLFPAFQLPRPDGPYGVGTQSYEWTDAGRRDIFSTDPQARRTLVAQVWYPARLPAAAKPAPYVRDPDALATQLARIHHVPQWVFGNLGRITSNAVVAPPPADPRDGRSAWPVLLFLEGASGLRQMNSFQAEALASHGYVVVGIDHPRAAAAVVFSDGRTVPGLPLAFRAPSASSAHISWSTRTAVRSSISTCGKSLPHDSPPRARSAMRDWNSMPRRGCNPGADAMLKSLL